jgi:shikimate dehydrogenase
MHQAAYAALGLDGWRYQRLPVPPVALVETVRALPAAGFHGANVTIPHKEAALALADTATDAAQAIGAANTLTFHPDGTIHADNTDAPGTLAALEGAPPPRTALVLGAGGSARAVVWALREHGVATQVWNRTRARAEQLGAPVADRPDTPADLLVNCTSVGLDDPDAAPVADASLWPTVVDLVYRDGGTRLIRDAAAAGARTVDGLEVLVRQGALSFERWTGRAAPLDVMRRAASTPAP